MIRACLVIVLIMVIVNSGIKPTHADDSTALRRPITALWADPAGSRLLIGRGTMLILAEVTPTAVVVTHEIPLERGIIGGVGMTAQGILVALTERGIFTLTPDRVIIDNLPGGGNTLRIVGDQILIAALDGGVRLAQISPTGVITLLGELKPQGKAFSAALDVNQAHVWVAEGAAGVHAYALQGGAPLTTLNDVTNADQVLRDGTLLYVAGSGTLYVFDLATGTPRLQTRLSLEPTTKPEGASAWVVSDMLAIGSRLYIGRYAGNGQGADALIIDLTATSATLTGQIGISGSGEHLALRGDDLFVGSVNGGLQRVYVGRGEVTLIAQWDAPPLALTESRPCAPTNPRPPDRGEADNPLTLEWDAGCAAATYEVWINGVLTATLPETSLTFNADTAVVAWRVVALTETERAESATWRVALTTKGWLSTPSAMPAGERLYTPPFIAVNYPGQLFAVLCGAVSAGLLVIVAAALFLGNRAQRRMDRFH